MKTETREPLSERQAQLRAFLRWLIPVAALFGGLEAGAGLLFEDPAATTSAMVILGYAGIGLVALALTRRGQTEAASVLLAVTIALCAFLLGRLQPEIHSPLAIVPLLGAVIAYPYLEGRALAWVLTGAVASSAAIEGLGSWLQPSNRLPAWFVITFRSAATAAVIGLIALFLWQHRNRMHIRLRSEAQSREGLEATVENLRRMESEARSLAFQDSITRLPNRLLFFDRLDRALVSARRAERRLAVVFLDLDGFKRINDDFGHEAGDQALEAIGERLRSAVREEDTAARYGGDEFTVLLPNLESTLDAERVVGRLAAAFLEPVTVETVRHEVTISVGIAMYPDHGETPQDLLRAADGAMYRAKVEGGACYAWAGSTRVIRPRAPGTRDGAMGFPKT